MINGNKVHNSRLKRLAQPRFTLVSLLVFFLCQIFTSNLQYSVEYPESDHPLGLTINHHHGHNEHLALTEKLSAQSSGETEQAEHEHTSHVYTACYLVDSFSFEVDFYQAQASPGITASYQNCSYAPPNPPPTA